MRNIFPETIEKAVFMPEEKGKTKTITFEPDEDVAESLSQLMDAVSNAYGFRTKVINEALRRELPNIVRRQRVALEKLEGKRAA